MPLSYSRSTSVQTSVLFVTPMSLKVKGVLAHTSFWVGLRKHKPDAQLWWPFRVNSDLAQEPAPSLRMKIPTGFCLLFQHYPDTCNNLVCLAFKKWLCKGLQFIGLTRRWRLNLRLFLGISSAEDFWRGLLPSLNLALEGKQVLNVLFFQGAGCAARSANVQGGCQLTPLLVFINLAK